MTVERVEVKNLAVAREMVKSMAIESPPAAPSDEGALSDVFIRSLTHGDEMQGSDILVATLEMAGVDTT